MLCMSVNPQHDMFPCPLVYHPRSSQFPGAIDVARITNSGAGSEPRGRTGHLRLSPNHSLPRTVLDSSSDFWSNQTTFVGSPTVAQERKFWSRAPNCSGKGRGRSTTHFCLYIIYYHNNSSRQWPHYFPTRDLFPTS